MMIPMIVDSAPVLTAIRRPPQSRLESNEQTNETDDSKFIDQVLCVAAIHLEKKKASAFKPETIEDLEMRLSGATIQHRLTEFVLRHYDSRTINSSHESRLIIRQRLNEFWDGYWTLLLQPLVQKGMSLETLKAKKTAWRDLVLPFRQGAIGSIATAILAKEAGFKIALPSASEDVRSGIDIFVGVEETTMIPMQIKCQSDAIFIMFREKDIKGNPTNKIRVIIPTDPQFFLDESVGIPNQRHVVEFKKHFMQLSR